MGHDQAGDAGAHDRDPHVDVFAARALLDQGMLDAMEPDVDLIDALIYGDVFDCAVTLEELWRYSRVAVGREELQRALREDPALRRLVVERDGLYCLQGRTALLDERPPRIARARRLQRRARRVARALRHLPFVRGLLLTGSASADDARERDDADLLVIVAPERLGTAFLLLGSMSRLLRRRLFCPNWYMREDRLATGPRSLYIARELAQARSLAGSADTLRTTNPWLTEVFPNAVAPLDGDRPLGASPRLQRLLEAPLRGTLGDRLERLGRRVARARLRAHHAGLGQDVPAEARAGFEAGVVLGFHGLRYEARTVEAHGARQAQLRRSLG